MAIGQALTVIWWQENLLPDEMPPEWMWNLPDELDDWFAEVEAKREDRTASGRGRDELEDAPDMMQNELTRGRR